MASGEFEEPKFVDSEHINAYFRQTFRSLHHHWQRSMAEEARLSHEVNMLRKELRELAEARGRDAAKIGELQERIDGAAKVITEMRRKQKGE